MRWTILPALVAAVLAVAPAALAHHADSMTADCTAAKVTYTASSDRLLTTTLLANGTVVATQAIHPPTANVAVSTTTIPYAAPVGPFALTTNWTMTYNGKVESSGTLGPIALTCSQPTPPTPQAPPATTPPAATPTPVTVVPTQPVVQVKPPAKKKAKPKQRCARVVRYDRQGHRLRDSHGRRIALCKHKKKPRPPIVRRPNFTG